MPDFNPNDFCRQIHKLLHTRVRAGVYCTPIEQDDKSYTIYISLYNQTRDRESMETTYKFTKVDDKIAYYGSEKAVVKQIVDSVVSQYKHYILDLYFVNGGK